MTYNRSKRMGVIVCLSVLVCWLFISGCGSDEKGKPVKQETVKITPVVRQSVAKVPVERVDIIHPGALFGGPGRNGGSRSAPKTERGDPMDDDEDEDDSDRNCAIL